MLYLLLIYFINVAQVNNAQVAQEATGDLRKVAKKNIDCCGICHVSIIISLSSINFYRSQPDAMCVCTGCAVLEVVGRPGIQLAGGQEYHARWPERGEARVFSCNRPWSVFLKSKICIFPKLRFPETGTENKREISAFVRGYTG